MNFVASFELIGTFKKKALIKSRTYHVQNKNLLRLNQDHGTYHVVRDEFCGQKHVQDRVARPDGDKVLVKAWTAEVGRATDDSQCNNHVQLCDNFAQAIQTPHQLLDVFH